MIRVVVHKKGGTKPQDFEAYRQAMVPTATMSAYTIPKEPNTPGHLVSIVFARPECANPHALPTL